MKVRMRVCPEVNDKPVPAPLAPSTQGRGQFESKEQTLGEEYHGGVRRDIVLALCLADSWLVSGSRIAKSISIDRGRMFLFTGREPGREAVNVPGKGLKLGPDSESYSLSCSDSGRGPHPHLGQSDVWKCWILSPKVRGGWCQQRATGLTIHQGTSWGCYFDEVT